MLLQGCACGVVQAQRVSKTQHGQWPNTFKFDAAVNTLALVHTNTLYECIHCISQEIFKCCTGICTKIHLLHKAFPSSLSDFFSIIFILFYSIFLLEHSYPRVKVFITVCTLFVVLCCFVKLNFPYGGSIKINLI